MKPRILQKGAYMPALETALANEFDVLQLWRETDQDVFLARHGREFVGLATSARWGADAALISRLPNLKVIASFGVGYDTIDIAAAAKRGIPVGNTPDVLNDCVADIAFGLLIDVARGLSASRRLEVRPVRVANAGERKASGHSGPGPYRPCDCEARFGF